MEHPTFSLGSYLGSSQKHLASCVPWHLSAGTGHTTLPDDPGLGHPTPDYTSASLEPTFGQGGTGSQRRETWKCPIPKGAARAPEAAGWAPEAHRGGHGQHCRLEAGGPGAPGPRGDHHLRASPGEASPSPLPACRVDPALVQGPWRDSPKGNL